MKFKNVCFATLISIVLFSCGKDDEPQNSAPIIKAQEFTVKENVSENDVIGKVAATDPDGDALEFIINTNDNDLFEIDKISGNLSLAPEKSLGFEIATSHSISVSVSDGIASAKATITISVESIPNTNNPPEIAAQSFEVNEDISDADVIGKIAASDADLNPIKFSIIEDTSNLFEVDEITGNLTLVQGKSLDFETTVAHVIVVSVTDGEKSSSAEIKVNVLNVIESGELSLDSDSFITTWTTVNAPETIAIELSEDLNYDFNFIIDWGDGTIEEISEGKKLEHTYGAGDDYIVAMKGQIPVLGIVTSTSFSSIDQWGSNQWIKLAFGNCPNMVYKATDTPDLSQALDLQGMFQGCTNFNGDIGPWDVSNVTNMKGMFLKAAAFNHDLSGWDVSNVEDMALMFQEATAFNGDISDWNVSKVTDMSRMFQSAKNFNQDIGKWGGKTSNVSSMHAMFAYASKFDQDISTWNVSKVTDMESMFFLAITFDQNISDWDVSKVTTMKFMLYGADTFNQNLGAWDISNKPDLSDMLSNSGLSSENYGNTLLGWANQEDTPAGVTLGAEGLTVCAGNAEHLNARAVQLENQYDWIFDGDAVINCN